MTLALDKRGKLKLSEAAIQKQCVELLRAEGWIVRPAPREGYKASRGAHRVPAGEPDLIAVKWTGEPYGWTVLMIECKSATGRLSDAQQAWYMDHVFPMYVIRCVDELRELIGPSIRLRAAGSGE